MVDFLGRGDLTGPLALLAQWVGCDIVVTNPLPCAAIPALTGRVALVLVVMRRDDFLVFLAIAPGGQARAAGIGTGALGFVWHTGCRLLPGKKKAPAPLGAGGFCFFAIRKSFFFLSSLIHLFGSKFIHLADDIVLSFRFQIWMHWNAQSCL